MELAKGLSVAPVPLARPPDAAPVAVVAKAAAEEAAAKSSPGSEEVSVVDIR